MDVNVEPHNGSVDGGDDGRALVGPSNGGPGGKAGGQERLEPACAIKMLVPSGSAGCLIGKGGSTISELQERTGARIKLSQNNDFYPGTTDRIVLISGELEAVTHALSLVIEHLHTNSSSRAVAGESPMVTQVRLLIPKAAGGLIIGRGGASIRSLNEETGARIQLAAKDDAGGVVTGERIISVGGSLDHVLKGINRVLEKLNEEPEISRYQNLTTSYSRSTSAAHPMHPAYDIPTYHTQSFAETQLFSPGSTGGPPGPMTPRGMAAMPPPPPPNMNMNAASIAASTAVATIKIQIPDKTIGAILGKGGAVLRELQSQSGARISISKRGEYAPGTTNRIVVIEGSAYAAETARNLVSMKIQQSTVNGMY